MKANYILYILISIPALLCVDANAGVSRDYIDTNSLWQQGANAYNVAKKAQGSKAVAGYVDALTYLSAYYQRSPDLAGSNSSHAKSVRKVLDELEEYLSLLSGSADAKGDFFGQAPPPAPKGKLNNPSAKSSSSAVFTNPRIGGKRLDWCKRWGKECGKEAATAFCKRHEFSRAAKFRKAEDIGAKNPTRVLVGNQICNKKYCDGFSLIACVR